jgi:hypothetical protein
MDSVVKSKIYKLEDTLHFARASCIAVDKGDVEFSATLARELRDMVCRGQRRPLLWDVLNYFSISDYVEIIEGTEIRYLNLADNQAFFVFTPVCKPSRSVDDTAPNIYSLRTVIEQWIAISAGEQSYSYEMLIRAISFKSAKGFTEAAENDHTVLKPILENYPNECGGIISSVAQFIFELANCALEHVAQSSEFVRTNRPEPNPF